MRLVKRLLSFATPLHHYFPEYVIYTLFGIVFGLLNFAMLIPLLDTLSSSNGVDAASHPGEFRFGLEYFKQLFAYYFHYFSEERGKWYALAFV